MIIQLDTQIFKLLNRFNFKITNLHLPLTINEHSFSFAYVDSQRVGIAEYH